MSPRATSGPEAKLPLPPLRPDLIISEQKHEGRSVYILKDPISLQYLRLARHEYFLARALDGKRNLEDLAKLLQGKFAEAEFDAERAPQEVLQFLQQLSEKNFLQLPPASTVELVMERKKDRWKQMLQKVRRNIFFFRIPLFDPDRLLTRMYPPLRFIWTRGFMFLSLALMISALVRVSLDFDRLITPETDFFNWTNLFLIWVAFIGVKVIHEFGHGLTCKNYDGEVHEMGILFLAFTPALYCDTTDAWMMPKRTHRIWVSSAGIYVELIIAAIAAWVWHFTQPGLVNQLAMIVMFLCSFSTVVFNANPLLKYDGYYMLSDAIEVPNLQQKSYAYIMHLLRRWLFGERPDTAQFSQVPLPTKHRGFFAAYSIISYAYRWFVLFSIFMFVSRLLKPVGLESIGKTFALFSVFSSMILPIAMGGYYFFKARSTKPDPEPLTRPLLLLTALAIALVVAALLPVPQNVERACVLKPREGFVRAIAPGFVREVRVRDGQEVRAGEILAVLENSELVAKIAQVEADQATADVKIAAAMSTNNPSDLLKASAERDQADAAMRKARADLDSLTLRAPNDGVVQGFLLQDLEGRWVEIGQTFCQVAPTQPLRVVIPLDQREAGLVSQEWQVRNSADSSSPVPVKLCVYGRAATNFLGHVSAPPMAWLREIKQPELTSKKGGDVPTKMDAKGVERPSEPLYETELEIENPGGYLRPGMTGRAKIYCGHTTIARLMADGLRNLIVFDLQL